jgi:hypothetical protein
MAFTEFTADDLVYRVKMYDFSSGAQIQYEPPDILRFADDVIKSDIAPLLMEMNENFYLVNDDINFVVGQEAYDLPEQAMYNMIHSCKRLTADGTEYDLSPVPVNRTGVRNYMSPGTPNDYYIEDNKIHFFPAPASDLDKYRIFYYKRPSFLTLTENVAIIDSVNKVTGVVTYLGVPTTGFTASSFHDFYSSRSPFNYLGQNIRASALAGLTQTFPIPSVQNLSSGDAAAVTGYTHVPDVSMELFLLLVNIVIMRIAKAQNDTNKYQMSISEIKSKMADALVVPGRRITNQAISLNVWNSPLLKGTF